MDQSEKSVTTYPFFRADTPIIRKSVKQVSDALLAGVAWLVADQLWYVSEWSLRQTIIWMLIASMVGSLFQLTSPLYRLTAIRDIMRLGFATLTLLFISLAMKVMPEAIKITPSIPNIAIGASLLTGMLWTTVRLARRAFFDTEFNQFLTRDRRKTIAHPTLLVGAGRAGSLVAQELMQHPELGYRVVGFLDDSHEKQGALISGIRILGDTSQLASVTVKYGVTHAILAIPTATGVTIRRVVEDFHQVKVKVKTVPGILDLVGDRPWKPEVRDIAIEDLLRREPVSLDTGGHPPGPGGHGGAHHRRRAVPSAASWPGGWRPSGPSCLVLLGRGENSLWEIERDLRRLFPDPGPRRGALRHPQPGRLQPGLRAPGGPRWCSTPRPTSTSPTWRLHPEEAVENNIFGTLNVLEAALDRRHPDRGERLHRQGGEPGQRAGRLQAHRRDMVLERRRAGAARARAS